jgi:hypothetical protein
MAQVCLKWVDWCDRLAHINKLPETLFDDTTIIKQTNFDNIFGRLCTTTDTASKGKCFKKK